MICQTKHFFAVIIPVYLYNSSRSTSSKDRSEVGYNCYEYMKFVCQVQVTNALFRTQASHCSDKIVSDHTSTRLRFCQRVHNINNIPYCQAIGVAFEMERSTILCCVIRCDPSQTTQTFLRIPSCTSEFSTIPTKSMTDKDQRKFLVTCIL